MPSPILQVAERNKQQLANRESQSVSRLLTAYNTVTNSLQDNINRLSLEVDLLAANNQLSINKIRQLTTFGSLLEQVNTEITRYGGIVDNEVRVLAQDAMEQGISHSRTLTQSYFQFNRQLNTAFNATWDNLPVDQIETLLGFLSDTSPLHQNLVRDLGPTAASTFEQTLLDGMALGYNPKKINRLAQEAIGQPLAWSLNSIRTSQLWAYREATRANYLNNTEIVDGWVWFAALDDRVCLSCVANHGKFYSLGKPLNDHHRGRCVALPHLPDKFMLNAGVQLGEDWFNQLPTAEKVRRMGQAKYNAFQAGEFRFEELSETYENDVYGEMQKEASLRSLIGDRANRYYVY